MTPELQQKQDRSLPEDPEVFEIGIRRSGGGEETKVVGWQFSRQDIVNLREGAIHSRDVQLKQVRLGDAVGLTHIVALLSHALDTCDQAAFERTLTS